MLFRVDFEHFLTHMIDHFPREVLCNMHYPIVSAGVRCGGRASNVAKVNELYPSAELTISYSENKNKDVLRRAYKDELKDCLHTLYVTFAEPIMTHHHNMCITCMRQENDFVDILAEFIEEQFGIHCIDLNELFTKGHVDQFFLDTKEINNKLVSIRREFGKKMMKEMELTEGGRANLLKSMSKKEKIAKLRDIGIKVNKSDEDNLDNILQEAWVND